MTTRVTVDKSLQKRIEALLVGNERISQFARRALEEKVHRMESRDERARMQLYERDVEMLRPIVTEILRDIQA